MAVEKEKGVFAFENGNRLTNVTDRVPHLTVGAHYITVMFNASATANGQTAYDLAYFEFTGTFNDEDYCTFAKAVTTQDPNGYIGHFTVVSVEDNILFCHYPETNKTLGYQFDSESGRMIPLSQLTQ